MPESRPTVAAGALSASDCFPLKDTVCLSRGYGKLDYVVQNDEAILLDINKTIGAVVGPRAEERVHERRQYLAAGIKAFI